MALVDNTNIRRGIMVPKYWRHCEVIQLGLYGYWIVPAAEADVAGVTYSVTLEETSDIRVHFTGFLWTSANAWRRYDAFINRNGVNARATRGMCHNNAGAPSLYSSVAATVIFEGETPGAYTYKLRHHANGANDVRLYDGCFEISVCRS